MAYRGITDPFTPKTTRNERFAQMSRQEQLIEQKKREIQAKLEEQKKKEATEALKKFQSASGGTKPTTSTKVNTPATQTKSGRKSFWKSDQRWKKEPVYTDDSSSKSNSMNIFNNDGSFLDQFRKLSGSKDLKNKRDDDSSHKLSSVDSLKRESDTDWGTWNSDSQRSGLMERDHSLRDRHNSHGDRDKEELLQNSDRLGTSHWFQSHTQDESSNWQGQSNSPPPSSSHRPSSPYSPTRATTDPPKTPDKLSVPLLASMAPFPAPAQAQGPMHHPPALPITSPPPNMLQRPPVQQYIQYTAPPPPIHTVPPSIPPPSLGPVPQGAPPTCPPTLPASMSVPPPSPVLQHALPAPAQLLGPPPLLQQPPLGLPPPGALPPSVPSSVLVSTLPPPPLGQGVLPVPHSLPPPCVALSVPGPAAGLAVAAPGTGVSPAAPAVPDPVEEEATTHLARMVAQCGDDIEEIIKVRNPDDKNLWFLHSKNSTAYIQYRCLVDKFRDEMKRDERDSKGDRKDENGNSDCKTDYRNDGNMVNEYGCGDDDVSRQNEVRRRKRRSRWAPESDKVDVPLAAAAVASGAAPPKPAPPAAPSPMLTKVSRTDPALVQYAVQAFGTCNLSEDDWRKAEDHYKINLLYQDMIRKRRELERLQRAGKFKYEYDSDEETDGGTWEHRLRTAEMEATQLWADELTKKAEGKHHIGDFLPPDELERFMEKYSAFKEGREPDLSDYKEFKLKEDNIGFQMLQKLGWSEGQGLGTEGTGIVDPVNKATTRPENQGLGLDRPDDVSKGDDEYDAYRKRMMLAYRFRPNPLNNPRRPYY